MTLEEYDKKIQPGMRVYVSTPSGEKLHGIAGNLIGAAGIDRVIKFDGGAMGKVTAQNCHVVQVEALN